MMPFFVYIYALLILVSIVSTCYSLWAYQHCPSNRSHRPLVFPIVCSISWFLISVDQLVAVIRRTHGSTDGLTMVMLVALTLAALLYFVQNYVQTRGLACAIHPSER